MAKDNYSSRAYNFLVKSGYIDPQEVNFNSFNAQMSNPEFSRSVYSNFENAKKNGKIGKLKPYDEFVAEFGVTETPTTTTTHTEPQQTTFPTPEELSQPVIPGQPLPNVGVPPNEYNKFKSSLPDNLKNTPDNEYDMKYLWEQSGKPKSFNDAINRDNPLFTMEDDGFYHAPSVESNTGRFLKPKNHPTLQKELDWYNSDNPEAIEFRSKNKLDTSGDFYRYTPNQPQVTPTGLPTMEALEQGVQPMGGQPVPGTDPLANAPHQDFQWSRQQAPGVQPVVQPQGDMPQTPEQGMQEGGINPYEFGVTKLGEFEGAIVGQIGSELKGIAETGYSLDNKIVSALEGTPFEGSYKAPYSKPEDSWLYQAGQGMQNFAEKYLYRNPEYAGGVSGMVAQGLGSVATIAMTGLNPAGGILKYGSKLMTNPQLIAYGAKQLFSAPMVRGALAMVGQETDSARQLHRMANQMDKDAYVVERMALGEDKADAGKAWETLRTKTEDEVAESMILPGMLAGVTEAIPLERLLVRLGKPAQNIIVNAFKQGGIQGAEEASQEVIQQTIINAGIGNTYNEAQKLTTGLLESAEGGGATGFVLGSVLTALVGKRANVKQRLQAGEISQKDAIAEMEDINKAEKLVQDKLQALDNVVNSKANEEIKALTDSKEAQTFFETNEPSLTNPLVTMPAQVETILDKIANGVLVSPESLHEAYQWANGSVKATLENQALTPAEKGATLNIFNGMLSDIDKANTEGQKFVEEVETVSVQDRVPAVRPEGKLPEGQKPGVKPETPALDQAKQIREKLTVTEPVASPEVVAETTTETEVVSEPETRTQEDFANENESYRVVVGDEAFNDILESGVVRTNADSKGGQSLADKLAKRPTAYPSFSRGSASMEYANANPNNYIIVTEDSSIQPSKSGRHGKGTTMFPTDENGNHLRELSGEKVKVYKHIGDGKYELVYANGKPVNSKSQTTTEPVTSVTTPVQETVTAETVATEPVVTAESEPVALETTKPEPKKVKVLGKEMNIYNNYIPSKAEDIEPDAVYSFNASSKEGLPAGLHDVASVNTSEVNGVKKESWSASIGGDELIKQYPATPTSETIVTPETTETQVTVTEPNATDVETITKIENATEKGRELALNKPTNKGLKRAFETFEDLSARALKAGIYDGKTLKIGGQEVTLDTPAKFKAFLANQGNFDALSEAVKDVKADVKEQPIPEPTPKQVETNANEKMEDAKSTFVFPIGLNPRYKFDPKLPQKVVNFFKKYFRPRGLWTPELFRGKRMNEARIASQTERTKFKVRDLVSAVKKAYPKGVKPADVERMNDFLTGNPVELPPALYKPLEAMREHIDELSRLMIEEGIIDEKLVPVFDANMGVYTTRTYKIHNDPKSWIDYIENEPEGQQIRNEAVNFVRQETEAKADRMNKLADKAESLGENLMRRAELRQDSDPEGARRFEERAEASFMKAERLRESANGLLFDNEGNPTDFDAQIDAFLFDEGQPLGVVRKGNVGAKDLGILKKRGNIPEAIRKLMGEEKDPLINYMMSVAKMSALISNQQFLNEAKVQGLRDGTFTTKPKGENIVQIASENTQSMNPLNGLYTTPEIAQAFKEFDEITKSPWYLDWLLKFNAVVKLNKTVLSETTHVRNFISNPIIELANGAFRLGKLNISAFSQYEQVAGMTEGERRDKMRAYVEKLTKLGVLDQGGNYRDMLAFYDDLKGNKFDYQKVIEPKLTKGASKAFGKIKDLYKAEDDFWKVYAFENEKATLKEAYPDKTDSELDELAAEKVLRTRINYGMAPLGIKAVRKFPFAGTFVTFPAEVLRIAYNIPGVAMEEMKSGNPVLQKQGAKRMGGYLAAMASSAIVSNIARYVLGMDDEEEEARKKFIAPWAQNSTLIWLDENRYVDTGYSDAFNILKKPVTAAYRGADFVDSVIEAVKEFSGPFISEELGYKTLENVKNNRDEYDNPIYNENADSGTKASQIASYILKKAEPGVVSQLRRVYKGETGELSEKGQKYETMDEVYNAFGQKVTTMDWDNAILFKMKAEAEDIRDSNGFYNKANKSLPKSDIEGRKKEAEITNLAVEENYNNIKDYYESAKKIGYSPSKIVDIMEEAGVSNEIIINVVKNRPYKNYLIIMSDGTVLDREAQRRLNQ